MDANRPLLTLAGLCGATGVALAALASHQGGTTMGIAANFLLFHAPAFLALSLLGRSRMALGAALVLLVGLALFAGDLVMRERTGGSLFPMAAPIGGTAMIAGWLGVAAVGLLGRRR